MPCATGILILGAVDQPAYAGCSASNATVTSCDSTAINVSPGSGSSTLTVDGVSSVGLYYSPANNIPSGTYTETMTVTGATTLDSSAGQSNVNGGAGISMTSASGVTLNSSVTIGSGVTVNAHPRYGGGVFLRNDGSGTVAITNAGTVTVLGIYNNNSNTALSNTDVNAGTWVVDGLNAVTNLGAASVVNSGTVTAFSGRGLYSEGNYSAVTFDGANNILTTPGSQVTVSAENTASGTVDAYLAAIRVINYYGLALATNAGTAHSDERQAVVAWSKAGNATVTNSGSATADDRNAVVAATERGNATITNSGTATAGKLASGSLGTDAGYSGLRGVADYTGDVTITNTASGSVTADSDAAIVAHTPQGTVTVTNQGRITGLNGVFANSGIGTGSIDTLNDTTGATSTTVDGSVSLINSGTINATTTGAYLDGTSNSLTNSGTLTASGGTALVLGSGGTTSTVTNSGTLQGSSAAISGVVTTLNNSGLIAGDITNTGAAALTLTGGSGSYGVLTGYNGGSASLSSPGTVGTLSNTNGNISLSSGQVWLNDNLALGGHTFTVGGTAGLKVSNSLSIAGNYVQTGGSLTVLSPGVLTLTGSYSATVTNTAITFSGSQLTAGSSYTLVDSNVLGTYSGNTLSIKGTRGLSGVLSTADSGHDLIVTLQACPSCTYYASGITRSGNAGSIGAALDSMANSPTLSSDMSAVLDSLDALPSTTARAEALKQLAPSQTTSSAQMSYAATTVVTGAVEQHQQTAMNADGLATGASAGSEAFSSSLWGQVLGGGAVRGTTAETDGYRMHEFGLAFGVDHMVSDHLMGGVALSWLRALSVSSGDAAATSTLDSYQTTFYGTYRLDRLFVDGQAGIGYNRFHQSRDIAFLGRSASADYGGIQYLLRGQTGYDLPVAAGGKLTPLAGLTWMRAVSDGYTESGAGAANLSVAERGVNGVSHDLGAKLSWAMETDLGLLRPEVRAEWVHDYTQGAIATSGSINGASFGTTTSRLSPDGVQIGLAATLNGPDDLSFRVEYVGEMRPQYQSHVGMVKSIWGF